MEMGQELAITLPANPTTGFSWEIQSGVNGVLQPVGEPEFKANSDLLGAGGSQILRFETVQAGETGLTLVYRRPWEKDIAPEGRYTVHIIVR